MVFYGVTGVKLISTIKIIDINCKMMCILYTITFI